jgi:dTDP-4-dehydrorhamnose reductase
MMNLPENPDIVRTEEQLLNVLTRPTDALVEFVSTVESPLLVLGAGGKMGPSLCVLAKHAAEQAGHALEIIAVSRFTDSKSRDWLTGRGIKTRSADLLDREATDALPDAPNIINLTGLKFGTSTNPALTWATNTLGPALIAERYKHSRIVAMSTGNVYPLVPITEGGATEEQPLTPMGEYANAAVARERIFEYFAQRNGTAIALIRLSFAVELRYGVLVDIASRVWEGKPIRVANGWFNCIWQGDANEMILRALALASSRASAWNLSSPSPLSVRRVADHFGELFGKAVILEGSEAPDGFVSNSSKLCAKLGAPRTPLDQVIEWTAHWIQSGGTNLGKKTSFEVRDGVY